MTEEAIREMAKALYDRASDETWCDENPSSLKSVWVDGEVDFISLAEAAIAAWNRRAGGERVVPTSIDPCLEKREPDEPMFILLGRDSAAPDTIITWCICREREIARGERPDTPEEREHIRQVRAKVEAFRAWRLANRRAALGGQTEAQDWHERADKTKCHAASQRSDGECWWRYCPAKDGVCPLPQEECPDE